MARTNAKADFFTFVVGGSLFAGGVFLFSNQVMVRSAMVMGGYRGRFGGMGGGFGGGAGFALPWGTPGMGLLMIPLGIGVCLMFAGTLQRLANLLVWGSMAALFVGVLNSIRITFIPATLWQLGVYVTMIAAGGGLMFRSLSTYAEQPGHNKANEDLRNELEALKQRLDQQEKAK